MRTSGVAVREAEKPSLAPEIHPEIQLPSAKDQADGTADELSDGKASPPDLDPSENPLEPTDTESGQEYISGLQLFTVMTSVVLVAFMMLLDTSIIATAIPRITDKFHSLKDIGWYASAFQLSSSVLQPLTGKIYNQFSTKWSFMAFFAVFEIGSLICGAANSSAMLIVGRAVAGMGTSGMMNGALTIIAGSVPLHKRPAITGVMMGVSQLGIVCGPLVGGALTEYVSWRWCFYINLPFGGAVAIFLMFSRIPEQTKKPDPRTVLRQLHRKLDLVGFVLFAPAAIQLLLALQYGGHEYPWKSATIIGLFCGSAGTFAVWAAWNYRKGDDALIPLSMARKRAVWSSALTQTLLFSTMISTSYFMPLYFQSVLGASPVMSGVYTLPNILSQLFAAVLGGVLSGKFGYVIPFSLGAATFSSLGYGLLSRLAPDTSTGEWIGFQIISGTGRGMGMQMPLLAIQASVKPSEISTAISLLSFGQYLGTAVVLILSNTIFGEALKTGLAQHAPDADAPRIIAAGGTAFRGFVSPEDLPGVLKAFSKGTDSTFYLAVGLAASSFFTAWGMGWVDIRTKKSPAKGDA